MNATLPRIYQLPKPRLRTITPNEAMAAALLLIEVMTEAQAWPGTMSIDANRVAQMLESAMYGRKVAV